jgi:cell division protease FtsH
MEKSMQNVLSNFFISLNLNNYSNINISIIFLIFILFFLLIPFSEKIFLFFEKSKTWFEISNSIEDSDILNDNGDFDPIADFTSLDDYVIQVFNDTKIKFDDVAGNEEAKTELKEVVKFLKDPTNFDKLGASVPKGVLLGGPPGTGKTLLARAIAGESGTPFLKVSGSQFVELLVGVGAARVRELFEKARSLKPAIIFIDEIDSIARTRSSNNSMGGNDEREQTLNQILTEMDGFQSDTGIVVMAATNRIDILDPALKRPGRFDRQIIISYPNLKERLAILKVHARGKKFKPGLALSQIALRTIGFSGADLANLLNEAAILATRYKKKWITMVDINLSIDRIIIGLEGTPIVRAKPRQLTAFHEMGHALIGTLVNQNEKVEKLTLVPRGNTLGTTWTTPSGSKYNSRNIFLQQILIALAGRVAEEIVVGTTECSAGAQQDFAQITRTLRRIIVRYAMFRLQELKQEAQIRNLYLLGSDVKLEINNIIDNFTTNFLDMSYNEVFKALQLTRPSGERLVDELMLFEELSGKELRILANQYLSNFSRNELLSTNRKSSILSFLPRNLKKSAKEIDRSVKKIFLQLPN